VHWFDELSHLCGIRQCLKHTVWELPWDNVSRDGCHKYNFFESCPHQPPCVPEPPYHLVKAAIVQKQKAEEAAVANDKKKARKRLQNAAHYAKKKQKLEQEKQKETKDEVVGDSDEEESDENSNPNTNVNSSPREHVVIE